MSGKHDLSEVAKFNAAQLKHVQTKESHALPSKDQINEEKSGK